jgi:hypothetical protein
MKSLILTIVALNLISFQSAFAEENLSCDLSVSEVYILPEDMRDEGDYEKTADSWQWFSVFASNKGIVYPKDRLEKEQLKDLRKDGYDYYYGDKMVQTSIPQLTADDKAIVFRQGSWFDLERSGSYATIQTQKINDSIAIDLRIYKNNKIVLTGNAIMLKDEPREFLMGNSIRWAELKDKYGEDADEEELIQEIDDGEVIGYYMNCDRR